MFVKVTRQRVGQNVYRKVLIAESYREGGTVRHRTLAYLGALSQKDIESLISGLNRLKENPYALDAAQDRLLRTLHYGDALAVGGSDGSYTVPRIRYYQKQ